jgi:hypothetical protein
MLHGITTHCAEKAEQDARNAMVSSLKQQLSELVNDKILRTESIAHLTHLIAAFLLSDEKNDNPNLVPSIVTVKNIAQNLHAEEVKLAEIMNNVRRLKHELKIAIEHIPSASRQDNS